MASDYRAYLAVNLLNEDRIITYRLLSRSLRVHVNTAKEMLYDFHRQQNGKKPGTVHATYLVAGTIRKSRPVTNSGFTTDPDADSVMQSSPYNPIADEAFEESPVLSITLVREEDLEELRPQYEAITSIHVYSLEPHPLKNMQALSDAAREIMEKSASAYAQELPEGYGTIRNKGVRRRKARRPPPSTALAGGSTSERMRASAPKPADGKKSVASTGHLASKAKPLVNSSQASTGVGNKNSQEKKNPPANPPQLKRDSSSIFKSFAKAKPKLKREGADSSAAASGFDSAAPSGGGDETMKDVSDDDEEDTYVPPSQAPLKEIADADRKTRNDREAALRKMMDDDDPDEEPETVAEVAFQPVKKKIPTPPPAEEAVQVTEGRRRGRRRVLKKKTVKDEEGYLVTREEPAWESFSEDEIVATKPKPPSSFSSSSEKPKKGSNKPGQGSIMSFFGKK